MSLKKDEPLHMFTYWRDKKGLEEALTEYYPNLSRNNPLISTALQIIKGQEALINQTMKSLNNEDDSDDDNN